MTSLPVQKPSSILELPSEIRRCIWTYVVVKDGHLIFRDYTEMLLEHVNATISKLGEFTEPRLKDAEPRSLLAVAFTCRQIYLEVAPIYYGQNNFCLSYYYDFVSSCYEPCQRFTEAIGPENANTITDLSFRHPPSPCVDQCLMLLPNVKRLRFDKRGGSQELNNMTSLANRYKFVTIFYGGEVWGPDKWSLYPEVNY